MFASALHCHHEKARAHFPRYDLNSILDQRSAALLLIEESVRRGFLKKEKKTLTRKLFVTGLL